MPEEPFVARQLVVANRGFYAVPKLTLALLCGIAIADGPRWTEYHRHSLQDLKREVEGVA